MKTTSRSAMVPRLLMAATVLMASAGCGSEMLRTGRAPVYLIVSSLQAGTPLSAVLRSDVLTTAAVFDDLATASIRVEQKNTTLTGSTSTLNTVTITRYHVEYRRADGRNTPGVDVPYGFDGGTSVSIDPNNSENVIFQIVRHQGKLEPPLKNLASLGGQVVISTIAEITFYGHDQNGNEVSVVGRMDVVFGDFPDAGA
jgi:hypothetical protein